MNEPIAKLKRVQLWMQQWAKYGLQALILLPVIAVFLVYRVWDSAPATAPAATQALNTVATTTISTKMLEERFGVRIRLIGVTAAGGMVDLRYKIIDKEKAAFLVNEANPVSLIIPDNNLTLSVSDHEMKHNTRLENGSLHFSFFPNTRNAVKPGTPVTVAFGAVHLEPIPAQ